MKSASIKMTNGRTVLVDRDIYELIRNRNIYGTSKKGYPSLRINGRKILLHHLVLPVKKGFDVDHIISIYDARRSNLRYLTHSQNTANQKRKKSNTSCYLCVHTRSNSCKTRPWTVRVDALDKRISSHFVSKHVAAIMSDYTRRNQFLKRIHSNFNVPVSKKQAFYILVNSRGKWIWIVFSKKSDGHERVYKCRVSPGFMATHEGRLFSSILVITKAGEYKHISIDRIIAFKVKRTSYYINFQGE